MIYETKGTCAKEIKLEVDHGVIRSVEFVLGCPGFRCPPVCLTIYKVQKMYLWELSERRGLFALKHKLILKLPFFSLQFSEKGNMMILSSPAFRGNSLA